MTAPDEPAAHDLGSQETSELSDRPMAWPVLTSTTMYDGPVISVRRDSLTDENEGAFERDVIVHPGAVGVVAIDDADRVLVVTQYRHPARRRLVELPAGLLDKPGEDLLAAAQRELAEEGHVRAERWSPLLELMTSPGMSDEVITIYLAEGIAAQEVPAGFTAQHEESTMTRAWVALPELVDAVLARRVTNAPLVAGVLAVWARRHGEVA